jgi:hypothetical protein
VQLALYVRVWGWGEANDQVDKRSNFTHGKALKFYLITFKNIKTYLMHTKMHEPTCYLIQKNKISRELREWTKFKTHVDYPFGQFTRELDIGSCSNPKQTTVHYLLPVACQI